MWVKRGALLIMWTCVAFTGTERKVVYTEGENTQGWMNKWMDWWMDENFIHMFSKLLKNS